MVEKGMQAGYTGEATMMTTHSELMQLVPDLPYSAPTIAVGVFGLFIVSSLVGTIVLEFVTLVRARAAQQEVMDARRRVFHAADNLIGSVDDVIMFPEGSKQTLGRVVLLLAEQQDLDDLEHNVEITARQVESLPYDKTAYSSLQGGWALEEGKQIVEREIAKLALTIETYQQVLGRVEYSRWNVLPRAFQRFFRMFGAPSYLKGEIAPPDEIELAAVNKLLDGDSGEMSDQLANTRSPPSAENNADEQSSMLIADNQGQRSSTSDGTWKDDNELEEVTNVELDDVDWVNAGGASDGGG